MSDKLDKRTRQRVANKIRAGMKMIERYGWRKGSFGTKALGFCIVGGVRATPHSTHHGCAIGTARKAINALDLSANEEYGVLGAPDFNDTKAKSMRQVLQFMERTARKVEQGKLL